MLKNILRNRAVIISILGAATIAFGLFTMRTRIDGSITKVLPEDDPVFAYNRKIEEQFGSTEEVILLVSSKQSVFDKHVLTAVADITETIGSIEGARKQGALSITTIAKTLPDIESVEFNEDMTGEEEEAVAKVLQDNPLFAGKFIGLEGKSTLVSVPVSVNISYNDELLQAFVERLENAVNGLREKYPFVSIELSGHPIIQSAIMQYMSNDLLKLFPIAVGVVMLILLFALRSFRAMLIPIMVTLISVIWTFGLKGLLDSPLTLTETVIPVILISLGCADGIHILTEFLHYNNRDLSPIQAVGKTMKKLSTPIILTSVTTAFGFSSLVFSSGRSLQNMGIFLAFGVLVAMGFSLLYIPIILASFTFKKKEKPKQFKKHFSQMRFLQHAALGIMRYWPVEIVVVLAMLGLSVLGLVRTEADTDEVSYFKKNDPVRQVTEHIEDSFGGIGTLYIVFESDREGTFQKPEVIYTLDEIQEEIGKQENVGYTMSLADYVKMLFYTMRGRDREYYTIPQNDLFVERLMRMIASEGSEDDRMLSNFINEDFSTACMHVRLADSNTRKLKRLLAEIEPVLEDKVPEEINVRYAGDYIRLRNGEIIVRSQIISLLVTIGAILVILSIFFRNPLIGMLITFPVSIAILFNFAVMWLADISLNPATAIIASVGLGVGVDYGIHFYSRFRILYLRSGKYIHSIVDAIVETSRGIFTNAVAVGLGFLVLLFSSYSIINDMGWLVAVSMIATALLTVTVIPTLLVLFKPKIPKKILFLGKAGLDDQ